MAADPLSAARKRARQLDLDDPLADFRDRFAIEERGPLYVDGNSLGRLPLAASERAATVLEEWAARLVEGWADWIDLPKRTGNALAPLIGAQAGEVVACDSVTVNLYKLADAVLTREPGPIAVSSSDFPTDRYVLQGLAGRHGVELREEPEGARLHVLSHVDYRSGAVADMAAVNARGPVVLWDLSHSAGAIEVDLRGTGAQLAVGCTYKYLNGGPGAPAFLYVHDELQRALVSPIQGWFGQRDQFAMGPRYDPVDGIERFLAGTPPIIALAAADEGIRLTAEAGMYAVARKTRALTDLFAELAQEHLAPLGFTVASPPARGGHVSLAHPDAWRINRGLIELAKVLPDFRAPDLIRFAFPALYTRFDDVVEAVERTRHLVESNGHEAVDAAPRRVT